AYEGLNPEYGLLDGTSMAAPHVTGVMALVMGLEKAEHPEWTAKTLMQNVIHDVLSSADPVPSLAGWVATGGRLDASAALGFIPQDNVAPKFVSGNPSGTIDPPVDHVRIQFNEPMNSATFDTSDIVSFYGPDGPVEAWAVNPVDDSNTKFDIVFDPQS